MVFKTFETFKQESLNEGLFDKLSNLFSRLFPVFKDPSKLMKSVQATVTQSGAKANKFIPKSLKPKDTVMMLMGDGKNIDMDFTILMAKLADLPDGSSLFQIVGTTSSAMLKALTGNVKIEDLTKNNIMAIVPEAGFVKGKPATMRLLRNVLPGNKDYVTQFLFQGSVMEIEVEKMLQKSK
jgi:hypothetical protein